MDSEVLRQGLHQLLRLPEVLENLNQENRDLRSQVQEQETRLAQLEGRDIVPGDQLCQQIQNEVTKQLRQFVMRGLEGQIRSSADREAGEEGHVDGRAVSAGHGVLSPPGDGGTGRAGISGNRQTSNGTRVPIIPAINNEGVNNAYSAQQVSRLDILEAAEGVMMLNQTRGQNDHATGQPSAEAGRSEDEGNDNRANANNDDENSEDQGDDYSRQRVEETNGVGGEAAAAIQSPSPLQDGNGTQSPPTFAVWDTGNARQQRNQDSNQFQNATNLPVRGSPVGSRSPGALKTITKILQICESSRNEDDKIWDVYKILFENEYDDLLHSVRKELVNGILAPYSRIIGPALEELNGNKKKGDPSKKARIRAGRDDDYNPDTDNEEEDDDDSQAEDDEDDEDDEDREVVEEDEDVSAQQRMDECRIHDPPLMQAEVQIQKTRGASLLNVAFELEGNYYYACPIKCEDLTGIAAFIPGDSGSGLLLLDDDEIEGRYKVHKHVHARHSAFRQFEFLAGRGSNKNWKTSLRTNFQDVKSTAIRKWLVELQQAHER